MAKCPGCGHDVSTPSVFNLQGWSQLTCPHCTAKLEMKPRTVSFLFLAVLFFTSWLGRLGHKFAVIADVLLVSATVAMVLALIVRPPVRLRRKALPKPEIRLDIDGPPK